MAVSAKNPGSCWCGVKLCCCRCDRQILCKCRLMAGSKDSPANPCANSRSTGIIRNSHLRLISMHKSKPVIHLSNAGYNKGKIKQRISPEKTANAVYPSPSSNKYVNYHFYAFKSESLHLKMCQGALPACIFMYQTCS